MSAQNALASEAREASGVTSRLLLCYLERVGGREAIDAVLDRCGLTDSEAALWDENTWFSFETKIRLFEATQKVLDKPDFLEEMGALALDLNVAGALKVALRTLGSPQFVYRNIVRANARFNGSHVMELLEVGNGHARMSFREIGGGRRFHPLDCEYNRALLPAVPRLFGLPSARLAHPQCVADGADACVYELTWQEQSTGKRQAAGLVAGTAAAGGAAALFAPVALPVVGASAAIACALLARNHLRALRDNMRHLERQADDNAGVAQRLFETLQDLTSDLLLDDVLAKVTHHAQEAVGGREFVLLVREGDGLRCQASSGLPAASVAALESWSNGTPRVFEQAIVLDDISTVAELAVLAREAEMPLNSVACAPLVTRGEPFGVLVALGTQQQTFLPRDVEVLQSYAAQAAIALANARRYDSEKRLAAHDPLTGLLNHRRFHETLDERIGVCDLESEPCTLVLVDLDRFKRINDEDGHAEGDRFLRAAARALAEACREDDLVFRVGGDEFALILSGVDFPLAERVARRTCRAIAAIDPRSGASFGVAELRPGLDKNDLLATADANLYANKTGRSPHERAAAADDAAISVLIAAMAAHDEQTADHSLGVAELADMVAGELRLTGRDRALVQHAARVHDIGKLAIPGEILRKPSALTPAERELIETHPARGAEVLRRAPGLVELASVVHASHERWDGQGYPRRLAGEEIPLASRIVAVCDAYDAIVSDRPYRPARTHEEAIAELRRMAGSQFDPEVVTAFIAVCTEVGVATA